MAHMRRGGMRLGDASGTGGAAAPPESPPGEKLQRGMLRTLEARTRDSLEAACHSSALW